MRGKVKKWLSLALALILMSGMIPVSAVTGAAAPIPYQTGDTLTFGSYPQALETNDDVIAALMKKVKNGDWKPFAFFAGDDACGSMAQADYAFYADVTYQNVKYRGVRLEEYRPNHVYDSYPNEAFSYTIAQKSAGYLIGTTYWFRYAPIEWVVLDAAKGLAVARNVLDAQPFTNTIYEGAFGKPEPTDEDAAEPTTEAAAADFSDALSGWLEDVVYADDADFSYDDRYDADEDWYEWTDDDYWSYDETPIAWFNDAAHETYANDYATASIRAWLNGDFFNTAFTAQQQALIEETALTTAAYSDDYADYDSAPTKDRVFLLTAADVENKAYFKEDTFWGNCSYLPARGTDYAGAMGVGSTPTETQEWLLRTAGSDSRYACSFQYSYLSQEAVVSRSASGVRPAICLKSGDTAAGDIDGDGKINSTDARYALKMAAGLLRYSDDVVRYADTNGDGKVSSADARKLLRIAAHLESVDGLSRFFASSVAPTAAADTIEYQNKELVREMQLSVGASASLADNFLIRKGTGYKWASSNPSVVSVSAGGKIKALKKGFSCVHLTIGEKRYYFFVTAITDLQKKIYALQNKYPSGYYWNAHAKSKKYPKVSEIPCDHQKDDFKYCIGQCAGFADLLSDEVFGASARHKYTVNKNNIKIGDYLRCLPHHSVFVIDRMSKGEVIGYDIYEDQNYAAYEDLIVVAECNWDRHCGIDWGRVIAVDSLSLEAGSSFTRY